MMTTRNICGGVTADELPYWLEKGEKFFQVDSDPFLRLALNGIKRSLGRGAFAPEASTGSSTWHLNFSH